MSGGDIAEIANRLRALISTIDEVEHPSRSIAELQRVVNLAQQGLRRIAMAQQHNGSWATEGFTTLARWLSHHGGLPVGAAGALVVQARHLEHMPHSMAMSDAGLAHEGRVRLLTQCRAADPEHYDESLDRSFAAIEAPRELAVAAREWLDAARARTGRHPSQRPLGISLAEALDGTWRLHGTLGPGDGKLLDEALQKHLRPMLSARRDGDPSLSGVAVDELRAQALIELADADLRRALPRAARNNRYRINLVVRLEPDGTFSPGAPMPPEAWCDATFIRTVLGAPSEILDVGRATRNWPDAIATAVSARDRHCRFPGCDTVANRCDIHHRTHWEHGGATSVDNGILLCRRHHTFIHRQRWRVALGPDDQPEFHRPDGSVFARSPSPGMGDC